MGGQEPLAMMMASHDLMCDAGRRPWRWEEAVMLKDDERSRPAVRGWEEATTCLVTMGGRDSDALQSALRKDLAKSLLESVVSVAIRNLVRWN
mmetsp:Transcript_25568/g.47014  ORF Transcript_25568/g.47014 Transcript_25568/m.47014 type:complete len:93 (+) Transcript_25568:672-950(+)